MMLSAAVLMTTLSVAGAQAPAMTAQASTPASKDVRATAAAPADTPRQQAPAGPASAIDRRHRIEMRFGGWTDGWYGYDSDWDGHEWNTTGEAQGAFGIEFLSFIRNDLAVGIGFSTLANATGDWDAWDHAEQTQATMSIPVMVRWYPARRATNVRTIEPYVTAGAGPVFGVDAQAIGVDTDHWYRTGATNTRVATGFGARVGAGLDFRLGSHFTMGIAGARNWDSGLPDDLWRGAKPSGGEFTAVLGWAW